MIEWFERSRSRHDFVARPRRPRATGRRSRNGHSRWRIGAGSTPSRYSSAVPCRCSSSVCRLRNAICSGSRGSTSDSSVKTCARLSPARSRTNVVERRQAVRPSTPSSRRRLSQTGGRPRLRAARLSKICVAVDRARAGSSRRSRRASAPTDTGRRSADRRGRASDRSAARCETQTENTRASRRRTAKSWFGSISASTSWPTCSSATLRSANNAWSATGSHASSGMACGTSAGGRPSSSRQHVDHALRGRASAGRGCRCTSGSSAAAMRSTRCAAALHATVARRGRRRCSRERRAAAVRVVPSSTSRSVAVAAAVDEAAARAWRCSRDSAGWRRRARRPSRRCAKPRIAGDCAAGASSAREPHQAAADAVAKAVEADIDQRLRGALFAGRNRRVEQLVAGAEQRAAEHRFAAARDQQAAEPGRDQAGRGCRPAAAPDGVAAENARPKRSRTAAATTSAARR